MAPAQPLQLSSDVDRHASLSELAARVGVHKSTVSRALRNHPRVNRETCLKIQRLAREMGYRPDPHMLRLMARVREKLPPDQRIGTLGAWNPFPFSFRGSVKSVYREEFEAFLGAKEQADAMGYHLEEFGGEDGRSISARRRIDIMRNRGIEGILLFAHSTFPYIIEEDLSEFAAVSINTGLHEPRLHRVVHDPRYALDLCLKQMRHRGHSKVGLIIAGNMFRIPTLLHTHLGVLEAHHQSGGQPCPTLYIDNPEDERPERIEKWWKEAQPEAIVGLNPHLPILIQRLLGLRIPDDLGYASFCIHEEEVGRTAGVQSPARELGAYAIKRIISMLHTGEKGTPSIRETTFLPGTWRPGDSLKQKG